MVRSRRSRNTRARRNAGQRGAMDVAPASSLRQTHYFSGPALDAGKTAVFALTWAEFGTVDTITSLTNKIVRSIQVEIVTSGVCRLQAEIYTPLSLTAVASSREMVVGQSVRRFTLRAPKGTDWATPQTANYCMSIVIRSASAYYTGCVIVNGAERDGTGALNTPTRELSIRNHDLQPPRLSPEENKSVLSSFCLGRAS